MLTATINALDTLLDFVKYVLTPAGTGAIVYFIVTKLPYVPAWFEKLMPDTKRLTVMGLCLALPLAVTGGAIALKYLSLTPDTIYTALRVGIEAYLSSQLIHTALDLRRKRKRMKRQMNS